MVRPVLTTVALAAALLVPAAGAQAAGPVCNSDRTLCVSAVTITPATVSNAEDVTPTMTVTLSTGSPTCLLQSWDLPSGGAGPELQPVAGSPGVFRAPTSTVRAGSPGGAYYPRLFGCGVDGEITQAALSAAGLAKLTVTGTADITPPRVEALTVGSATVDATRADVSVPVTVTLSDAVAGVEGEASSPVTLVATPSVIPADQADGRLRPAEVRLTRASGTARRGVWSGNLVLPGGSAATWRLSLPNLRDRVGNGGEVTPEVLAARGLPSQVVTRTTAVPPAPKVEAVSSLDIYGNHNVSFRGSPFTANQPAATTWQVTTPSARCGNWSPQGEPGKVSVTAGRVDGWAWCTYTIRAVNGAGRSTATTRVSAFM